MKYKRIKYFILLCILLPGMLVQIINAQLPEVIISIHAEKDSVTEVLDQISRQTGWNFTYDASIVPEHSIITVSKDDIILEAALDSVFKDTTLKYELIDKNIVIYKADARQDNSLSTKTRWEFVTFTGIVKDAESKKPLPFANIGLMGTHLGTVSNQEGEFLIRVPLRFVDSSFVVSYIGYINKVFTFPRHSEEALGVFLTKDLISLQEVIIRYQDPKLLLSESLNRVKENYFDEHSTFTAYFREYVKKSKKYLVFSEAVFEIAREPYSMNLFRDQVKLLKGRKFTNATKNDTVLMKIKAGIASSLELDVVKQRPGFYAYDFNSHYELSFTDIVMFNDELVYELSFSPKKENSKAIYEGKLYIGQSNFALVAADFWIRPALLHEDQNMFIVRKSRRVRTKTLAANYHVDYKKVGEKYCINQVRGQVDFHIRKKGEWFGSKYSLMIEMAVTEVVPGKRTRYKAGESYRGQDILSDQQFEYDPLFWGDYNTIEPEKSLQEVIEGLKEKSLP